MTHSQDKFCSFSGVFSSLCHDILVKTHCCGSHPCGPTVDRLRRSTVGSGTREDVATTYELPVMREVVYIVYIAPVPAVFAAQLSPCAAPARLHRWSSTSLSPCRYRSICACDGVRWLVQ